MNTAKHRHLHDTSCGPGCPHWQGLFTGHGTTEPFELRTYLVLMMEDRYDEESERTWVKVRASGPNDARNQARLEYPHGSPLREELV